MVVVTGEHVLQADVIFVIEATAVNGAYINDLKTNYIIPTLEYFSQGNIEEVTYLNEHATCLYGIVLYFANDCLPSLSSDTIGPFSSPGKVLAAIDRLELIGGKGEYHANIAEGLATSLTCFEELQAKRDTAVNAQKHCILVCNSPPYLMPVMESQVYSGKTAEQMAAILQEKGINLSILSPRKIPNLYKLFEKAGGDLSTSQTKNYAKDPRHLVLLKGFSLKERPISPVAGSQSSTQTNLPPSTLPIMPSIPSPIGNESPIQGMSGHSSQGMAPGMVNVGMMNAQRGTMMQGGQFPPQGAFPTGGIGQRPQRWPPMMPPAQRPAYMPPGQQTNTTQSALIAQLTQPSQATGVNQFGQMGSNSPLGAQQQQPQQIRMGLPGMPQQVQPSIPQTVTGQLQQPTQPQGATANPAAASQAQPSGQAAQPMPANRERHNIWQGLLEWIEKPKNPGDPQKITKHVPCTVSANSKDGEPELKADGWPPKLIMQLMPKHLIGNIGGAYLKNSKSVLFHPQQCEALESLTKVMNSGFAGCVHFTSIPSPTCDIKVLILLYTAEKRAYLGFIPNDQVAFVDRLRKVIQQQKSTQMMRQNQGTGGPTINPQPGAPVQIGTGTPQLPTSSTPSQSPQQQPGMMMTQTNTLAVGGGQITQNVVTSTGPSTTGVGVLGQNVPGGALQTRMRMQNIQQTQGQLNQPVANQNIMAPGMMAAPAPRAPFENLVVERQQNLEKINQLKQTLEAAQQAEQQYKRQMEGIHNMKDAMTLAQQQHELQFKIMDQQQQQQRLQQQVNQQAATAQQQQRMIRPGMSNNPGLRHLLQQQPPFNRQQMMGMQPIPGNPQRPQMNQQMQNPGNNQQVPFEDVGNFEFM